jgi:tRNA A37 methylthiotransferase MiaB
MHREYMLSALGTELMVLFESESEGGFIGHSDTYISVFAAGENLRGQLRKVRIVSCDDELLRGIIVD